MLNDYICFPFHFILRAEKLPFLTYMIRVCKYRVEYVITITLGPPYYSTSTI